jgi:hypothetical protein
MPRFSKSHQPADWQRYRKPGTDPEARRLAEQERRAAAETDDWKPPTVVIGSPPAPAAAHSTSPAPTQEPTMPEPHLMHDPIHEPIRFDLTPAGHAALDEPTPTAADLRAEIARLEALAKTVAAQERARAQEARAQAQREAQAAAKAALAPLRDQLTKQLLELQQVQEQYDHVLRDYARSCAGDMDATVRRQVSTIHAQAGPLRERIHEAIRQTQAAIRNIDYAVAQGQDAFVHQAQQDGAVTLVTKPAALGAEAQKLIDERTRLRGGAVSTPRAFDGPINPRDPSLMPVRVDLGGSII